MYFGFMIRLLTSKKCYFLFVFITLASLHKSVAQSYEVKGTVTDEQTKEPLIGVAIFDSETKAGTATDLNGHYTISVSAGEHHFTISLLGYNSSAASITVNANSNHNFTLSSLAKELNAVTISGSRFEKNINEETVSISVIKPKQIQTAGLTQVDDMLKRTPGVDVIDGQPNIRGGSGWSYGAGSRVLVMVDDLPMLSADAADVKWDFLPIENCEQIEVIKGASSALYGSSALNGVINFRTAFPRSTPQTNIVIQQGIFDTPKYANTKWWGNNLQKTNTASFFHSRKIKQLDMVVGGNYFSDDSYLQGGYNTRVRMNTNLRYGFKNIENLFVGLNINAQASKGSLFFLWAADDKPFTYKSGTIRPDSLNYLTPSGGVDTPATTLSAYKSYRMNVDPYLTYATKSGYKFSLRNRFFNTINNNNKNQSSNAQLLYSEFQVQKKFFNQLNINAGAVANHSYVKSDLYSNHSSLNLAYYAQVDEKLGDRLWLTLGGRYEYYKLDTVTAFSKPLGRAGINFQVAKATFLRASYGMGYRFPTIAEKFVNTSISIVNVVPNPNLKPETGWNAELGLKQNWQIGKWLGMIDLAAFYTRYDNMMDFVFDVFPNSKVPFGFQSRNVTNALIKGIDATLFAKGNIGKVNLTLTGGYTYTLPTDLQYDTMSINSIKIRYSDTTQNILKYRYIQSAKADLEINWNKFTVGGYVRYNTYVVNIDPVFNFFFPSIAEFRKKQQNKDIWVIDARIIYTINNSASVSFIAKNILNNEYSERPAFISPVRSFVMQFVYKF